MADSSGSSTTRPISRAVIVSRQAQRECLALDGLFLSAVNACQVRAGRDEPPVKHGISALTANRDALAGNLGCYPSPTRPDQRGAPLTSPPELPSTIPGNLNVCITTSKKILCADPNKATETQLLGDCLQAVWIGGRLACPLGMSVNCA